MSRVLLPVCLLLLDGCFRDCEPVDAARIGDLPAALSETGLYADITQRTLADGVIAYEPNYALWADGAGKGRWLLLPEGGVIDASDADEWRFPEGTRAWKEFRVDDVAVETRMIEKVGPGDGDWAAVSYQWTTDGSDAHPVVDGVDDVSGTDHDLPSAEECVACHGGRASFVLGFSAVQLAGASPYALDQLVAEGRVAPTPGAVGQPSAADGEALGYLHANCSHCHNPERPEQGPRCYTPGAGVGINFTLPATVLVSVRDAPALQTAESKIQPGAPEESEVLHRMSLRTPKSVWAEGMPPLGTEVVDEDAISTLEAWIAGL